VSHAIDAVRTELHAHACAEQARALQRYFQTSPGGYGEGDRFIGVRVPVLRTLAAKFRSLPLPALRELLRSPVHEERSLALLIMVRRAARADADALEPIYRLYIEELDHVNNWDLVDTSAGPILGAWLWSRPRGELYRLAGAASLWHRRIAIMATSRFIRLGDFDDTLRLAERLLDDREDLIHKAVGWMLREVGKRDRRLEEAFLQKHGRRMPRTMLRYAIERFPPAQRRRYLETTR